MGVQSCRGFSSFYSRLGTYVFVYMFSILHSQSKNHTISVSFRPCTVSDNPYMPFFRYVHNSRPSSHGLPGPFAWVFPGGQRSCCVCYCGLSCGIFARHDRLQSWQASPGPVISAARLRTPIADPGWQDRASRFEE
jgi:hypothetical protein